MDAKVQDTENQADGTNVFHTSKSLYKFETIRFC